MSRQRCGDWRQSISGVIIRVSHCVPVLGKALPLSLCLVCGECIYYYPSASITVVGLSDYG